LFYSAAVSGSAIVVDCGLKTGLTCGVYELDQQFGNNVCRLGISPSKIPEPLDPLFHQHIIFTNYSGWSNHEKLTEYVVDKFDLVESLAGPCSIVCVLANNGHAAWLEVVNAVQRNWPVILIEGSGMLADDLCNLMKQKQCEHPHHHMKQVYHSQLLYTFPKNGNALELAQCIHIHFMIRVKPLRDRSAFWWKSAVLEDEANKDGEELENVDEGDGFDSGSEDGF
jgi:hypothetical protein